MIHNMKEVLQKHIKRCIGRRINTTWHLTYILEKMLESSIVDGVFFRKVRNLANSDDEEMRDLAAIMIQEKLKS